MVLCSLIIWYGLYFHFNLFYYLFIYANITCFNKIIIIFGLLLQLSDVIAADAFSELEGVGLSNAEVSILFFIFKIIYYMI